MRRWFDQDKLSKYGEFPFSEPEDKSKSELYAQGRDLERNRKLRATRLFQSDLSKCKSIDEIIELSHGIDMVTYRAARKLKYESAKN